MRLFDNLRKIKVAGIEVSKSKTARKLDGYIWDCTYYLVDRVKSNTFNLVGCVIEDGVSFKPTIKMTADRKSALVVALRGSGFEFDDVPTAANNEEWIERYTNLIAGHLDEVTRLKKLAKKSVLFRLKDAGVDDICTMKNIPYSADAAQAIREAHGERLDIIINEVLQDF